MSKKAVALFILLALAAFGAWWLRTAPESAPRGPRTGGKLRVVTSGYVPYSLAKQIGGEDIEVQMLVPPGTEPHHFEPTPGAIIAVKEADLFVYTSPAIEPWTQDILAGLDGGRALAAGPVEEDQDPHVWMTPYGALAMARRLANTLADLDTQHAAKYRQNLKTFEKEIAALHRAFQDGLADCKSRAVVHVGHLAFGELAHTYELDLRSLSGTSHQGEHSVKRLAELVRFIRKGQVRAVFTEELVSPELARTVAGETGVRVLPLYTVEEVSKRDFEQGKTYLDYMRQNLKNLQEGLQCKA